MVKQQDQRQRRQILIWGGTTGFGFGALLDVIIFHQILQTHNLLSGIYDPYSYDGLRTNIMFDGLFNLGMLAIMGVGLVMIWRLLNRSDERYSGLFLGGAIVVGMAIFNVFDGVVTHYILDLHNAVHGTEAWNPPWIVVSIVLLIIGAAMLRRADGYKTA